MNEVLCKCPLAANVGLLLRYWSGTALVLQHEAGCRARQACSASQMGWC